MKFRMGINYWPVSSAMYWWQRFDSDEVNRDFARIRAAGFDSVRVFLLWEDFQPAPEQIDAQSLRKLATVADIAKSHELSLVPTLFTGYMNGVNWIPAWALEAGTSLNKYRVVSGKQVVQARLKNWYGDPDIATAQARLATAVATTLRAHPALWAYDLGNGNSNCVTPPTRELGVAWLAAIARAIRSVDSSHPITIGLHLQDLEEDRNLGPSEVAAVCDFLCMYGNPLSAEESFSPTDKKLLPFLSFITRWLSSRDVVMNFGVPTISQVDAWVRNEVREGHVRLVEEEDAAFFTHRTLEAIQQFGCLGSQVWCYGDYDQALWLLPPFDEDLSARHCGLWRRDYSRKPTLVQMERFAGIEQCKPPLDFEWIDISPEEYYLYPKENLHRLYQLFCERYPEEAWEWLHLC